MRCSDCRSIATCCARCANTGCRRYDAVACARPPRHGALRLDRTRGAAQRRLVPVGRGEIAALAADMPLLFAKDAQTGAFELVALVGLIEPANLFVSVAGYHATSQPRAAGLTALRLDAAGAGGWRSMRPTGRWATSESRCSQTMVSGRGARRWRRRSPM
ncbi:SapC family protein [Sphingomonas sp. LR60]|uniref:SapC family protein n=1 Tax=Sphingomonas sp. LR60 TaxID=3050233 RepID=UPI002FE01192